MFRFPNKHDVIIVHNEASNIDIWLNPFNESLEVRTWHCVT